MSLRRLYGQLQSTPTIIKSSGAYTMTNEEVLVKQFSGSWAVTLPKTPTAGRIVIVKDGQGDAGSNKITLTPASGNIDGAANLVIASNYGAVALHYDGTQWGVVLDNLDNSGTTPMSTVSAAGSSQGDAAAMAYGFNLVTAANGTKGVVLPPGLKGKSVKVKNNVGQALNVYPPVGGTINALASNTALVQASSAAADYYSYDGVAWYTIPLLPS